MESPIDSIVDLGLVNYVRHPENRQYVVFRFADEKRAASFEQMLTDAGIWFEKGHEDGRMRSYTLFGIHQSDFKRVEQFNYRVEAKHKKPLIPFKGLRYFLIVFSTIVLTLAMIGYCKAQQKIAMINKEYSTQARPNVAK